MYPQTPPHVNLQTTGGGKVRFNPNLYAYVSFYLLEYLHFLFSWSLTEWFYNYFTQEHWIDLFSSF